MKSKPRARGLKTPKGTLKSKRDATAPFTFQVTARDVKKADTKATMTCALAKGCVRQPGVLSVKIGMSMAFVERKNFWERYTIQPEDRKKIQAFDNSRYFQPGSYTLVPPVVPLGNHPRTLGTHAKSKRKYPKGERHILARKTARHAVHQTS